MNLRKNLRIIFMAALISTASVGILTSAERRLNKDPHKKEVTLSHLFAAACCFTAAGAIVYKMLRLPVEKNKDGPH